MAEIAHQILDKKSIIKQVLIALAIGIVLLVGAVLPAEYGIDPLGIGKAAGFSKLYVGDEKQAEAMQTTAHKIIKMENVGSGPEVARPDAINNPEPAVQLAERTDQVNVLVPAGEGLEYKVNMLKHGNLRYEWITDKNEVYFDFHGEVKDNHNFFESYTIAYSNNIAGSFIAPFEGPQGWYFKNNSNKDITVRLKLRGQYLLKK